MASEHILTGSVTEIHNNLLRQMHQSVHRAADEMWGDFWEHEYIPWHQVNKVAVECFNRLRSLEPPPRRIPPELRCRASMKQRTGWELFQNTLPEARTTALEMAFRALPGPDVAAFLELMLVNNTIHRTIEALGSFWGKSTKQPPVGYPGTSREIPSLMIELPEVGNLLATLVVKLSAFMDDEQTMYKGFECLDRIFQMVTKRNLGDPSPAIPSIFKHVLHRLEEPYVVLCFAMFLGLAEGRPRTDDINRELLEEVGHRLREKQMSGLAMEILVSMNVVLAVRSQAGKCLMFPILFRSMEAMIGQTFSNTFSVLGLKRTWKNGVKEYLREGHEGVRSVEREQKGRTRGAYKHVIKQEKKLKRVADRSL